jgi:hypothetical protein
LFLWLNNEDDDRVKWLLLNEEYFILVNEGEIRELIDWSDGRQR